MKWFNEIHYLIKTDAGLLYMPKSFYYENFNKYSILYRGSLEEVKNECEKRLNSYAHKQTDNEPTSNDNKTT